MNNFKIEIYKNKKWVDYSTYCVFPLKIADFLDEQLDEAELFIRRIKDEYFNPLTIVRVSIINSPECLISSVDVANIEARAQDKSIVYEYNEKTKRLTEKKERLFVIASDNAIEKPIGSGFYEHSVYLIESTKILEGFIGDSISFTNTLFGSIASTPAYFYDVSKKSYKSYFYNSVEKIGTQTIVPVIQFANNIAEEGGPGLISSGLMEGSDLFTKIITIVNQSTGETIYSAEVSQNDDGDWYRTIVEYGETKVHEKINNINYDNSDIGARAIDIGGGNYTITYAYPAYTGALMDLTATMYVLDQKFNAKNWTITNVINRTFDLVEPLDYGQKPRFRLSGVIYDSEGNAQGNEEGSLAEKLDKILSPEFSFTKMTLREQLQQVGGFIHAEPRIINIHFDEDKPWFEVGFDKYGSNEKAKIKDLKKPVTAILKTDINNYATNLDTSADNLISQIDYANGVVCEPFISADKSLRSEVVTTRLGENDSTIISTSLPIYQIHKVTVAYIPGNTEYNWTDITPYVFEKADYDNKSSFKGAYPRSKEYALYYTQGQKHIRGLFFKAPDAVNTDVFSEYSIVNILRLATKDQDLEIPSRVYPELSFQVEYTPLYSTRIQTAKQTIIGGLPRYIAYNQSANTIESRFFGENLKGAIARMGNVEKTYTYNLAFASDIPKVGTKFDGYYYISTVSTEYLPSYIKCTIALSKDFNRLSEYIGISSNKRMWEISEKQSQARDSIHTEYVLLTENGDIEDDAGWFFNLPTTCLLNKDKLPYPISGMNIITYTKRKNEITRVTLPVISSSFGNSISFTSAFEDNYSAGQQVQTTGSTEVRGYWGQNVPYSDYYGRFYYVWYSLWGGLNKSGTTDKFSLPSGHIDNDNGNIGATISYGKKYRKDNREIPQITFQLSVVTDNDDIIIGSAMARNCWLVNMKPQDIELYVFRDEINKINSRIDFESAIKVDGFEITDNSLILPSITEEHVAWALVTKSTTSKLLVEDEDGEISYQTIYKGGELILGQNLPLTTSKTIYFKKKKYVYD